MLPKAKVCLSPMLLPTLRTEDSNVVVIDILRATTCMCAALDSGAEFIVPVEQVESCEEYRSLGYLCGAERNGIPIPGYDFGNSPFSYNSSKIKGAKIAMTTTNGTQAIHAAKNAYQILIGSFSNMSILIEYLKTQQREVIFLCSGWKNRVNLEDTVFAGAMITALQGHYAPIDDAAMLSLTLYKCAVADKRFYIKNSSHYTKLISLNLQEDVKYCLRKDTHPVIPVFDGDKLVRLPFAEPIHA